MIATPFFDLGGAFYDQDQETLFRVRFFDDLDSNFWSRIFWSSTFNYQDRGDTFIYRDEFLWFGFWFFAEPISWSSQLFDHHAPPLFNFLSLFFVGPGTKSKINLKKRDQENPSNSITFLLEYIYNHTHPPLPNPILEVLSIKLSNKKVTE